MLRLWVVLLTHTTNNFRMMSNACKKHILFDDQLFSSSQTNWFFSLFALCVCGKVKSTIPINPETEVQTQRFRSSNQLIDFLWNIIYIKRFDVTARNIDTKKKNLGRSIAFWNDWTTRKKLFMQAYLRMAVIKITKKISNTWQWMYTKIKRLRWMPMNYRTKSIQQKFNVIPTNSKYSILSLLSVSFSISGLFLYLVFSLSPFPSKLKQKWKKKKKSIQIYDKIEQKKNLSQPEITLAKNHWISYLNSI